MSYKIDYSRLNILVVEDEGYTRVITRRILHQIGVSNVAEARDGSEALNEVLRAKPDIIFCDINMEPMSGFEFVEKLRTLSQNDLDRTWVVILTSDNNFENRLTAEKHSVAGYLNKPVSVNHIREQIDRIVSQDPDLAARVHHGLPVDYDKLRVLVIDDETPIRKMIIHMLSQLGIRIIAEAADGMAALMEVAKFKPNLILCDVNMEPMNGIKFLQGLRQLNIKHIEDTAVIMLTADSSIDTVREAQRLSVLGYLIKPANTKDLRSRIDHAIRSTPRLFTAIRKSI